MGENNRVCNYSKYEITLEQHETVTLNYIFTVKNRRERFNYET